MVSIQQRWDRVSARLGVPHSAAVSVVAALIGCGDLDDLLKAARKSARRNALKRDHGKHVRKYLRAILEHRVAVESGTILQPKGVE